MVQILSLFIFWGYELFEILEILDYFFSSVLFFMWMVVGNNDKSRHKKEKKEEVLECFLFFFPHFMLVSHNRLFSIFNRNKVFFKVLFFTYWLTVFFRNSKLFKEWFSECLLLVVLWFLNGICESQYFICLFFWVGLFILEKWVERFQ